MPRKGKQSTTQMLAKKRESMRNLRRSRYTIMSVVQGRIHQGSDIFIDDTAGSQCTCMALMALVYNEVKNVREWDGSDIETILYAGDVVYQRNRGSQTFLLINELPSRIEYNETTYTIDIQDSLNGSLNLLESQPPFYTLEDAVDLAYTQTGNFFFLMGSEYLSFATMVFSMHDGRHFVFDSHSRNTNGLGDPNGKAVVLELNTQAGLVNYLRELAVSLNISDNSAFEVTPCSAITATDLFPIELQSYFERQRHYEDMQKREQRKERKREQESKIRAEPEVKAARRRREDTYLSKADVKLRKKILQKTVRSKSDVKKKIQERDYKARAEPKTKAARQSREKAYLSTPYGGTRKKEVQKKHRSKLDVKKRIQQRDSEKRAEPKTKAARQSRDKAYLSKENVRTRKKEVQKKHRSKLDVKKRIQQRDSEKRAEPKTKAARQSREKAYLSKPNGGTRKKEVQKKHRSKLDVKKRIQQRDSEKRADPKIKAARQSREKAYLSKPNGVSRKRLKRISYLSRREIKEKTQERVKRYRAQEHITEQIRKRERQWRKTTPGVQSQRHKLQKLKEQQAHIKFAIEYFHKKCKEVPEYVCCCCYRLRFKNQIQKFREENYMEDILISSKILDMGPEKVICTYCHQKMSQKKVSPISYDGNSIKTMDMPQDIGDLNPIEQLLLTPVIPFMKIVSLPKSQQHGVHGPIVCVPANVKETITRLPSLPHESGLIRVKLKRKLAYKGHHLYQKINPQAVKRAFHFLLKNHPDFSAIAYDEERVKSTMLHLTNEDTEITDAETINKEFRDQEVSQTTVKENQGMKTHGQGENVDTNILKEKEREMSNKEQQNLETNVDVEEDPITTSKEQSKLETNVDVEDPITTSKEQSKYNIEDEVTETSAPLVTCLQPEDLSQYISDKYEDRILCFAPAENQHPESSFNKEVQSFPTLFPNGKNAFSERRKHKLTFSQYIKSRLFSADTKFAMNTQYIFYLQYIKEFQEVLSSAKISQRKGSAKSGNISIDSFETEESLKNILRNNEGYKFLAKVRGSAPYWERTMKDLCAMVKQLGIPTWFCSFSAADRRWKEIVHAILKSQGKPVPDEMDWAEHCKVINSNPVIAAAMFDKRTHHLINDLIKSPSHPIGNVIDFFYRIEFQQRGWPHIHALFWVQDAPLLDRSDEKEVIDFIDKFVNCNLPHEEEALFEKVSKLQMHSKNHSRSCRKGKQTCRFNFPRPVSTRTFICKPIKLDEEKPKHIIRKAAREALEKLATITSDEKNISLTAQQCLELAGMTQEGLEYSMGILARKTIIVLKREPRECWVNQYNPHLLEAWDANIDIQYIVDAYACICYIVSYISKKESEEGELLRAAQKEAREGNTEAVNELRTLGKVYITHREISVMEAIYRCTGMKLKSSSREVRWVAADKDATRLSLPLNILKQQAREKRLDQIWAKSDLERYWNRPDNRRFENMSLAHFVANYRMYGSKVGKKSKENSGSENDDSDNEGKEDIALLNNFGYISARRRPIVIRYLKGSVDRDPERYYENRLRLFFPHRGQDILPSAFTSYETFHNNASFVINDDDIPISEIVNTNSAPFEKDAEVIDTALQHSYDDHEDAWADIAPGAEEQRIDDKMEQVLPTESDDVTEEVQLPDLDQTLPDKNPYKKTKLLTENVKSQISLKQAEKMVQSMNIQQLQIFNYMRKWCLHKSQGKNPKPFHIFLTGGAGTGKTHVINTFRFEAERILTSNDNSPNEEPDDIKVLLVAYTGTAAFNIQGQTIHSAFAIRSQKGKDRKKYVPLGEELLTELRVKYRNLQILIIDEISMVGQNMMTNISQRLNQIKQTTSTESIFGEISVLAVGDFYQVAPVADKALYVSDPGQLYQSEWDHFFTYNLSIIMRQKDDQPFANLLNTIRTKKKEETLQPCDRAMLLACVNDQLIADPSKLYIFPRNKEVDEHNRHMH